MKKFVFMVALMLATNTANILAGENSVNETENVENYCINVNTSLCLFRSSYDADAVHAAESEFWSRIVAL